jgi:hypothetical protein
MKFGTDRSHAMTELRELRDLYDRLRPDGGGYTIRQGGQDITIQERARLQAKILDLEAHSTRLK